jgi:hypothetical protein
VSSYIPEDGILHSHRRENPKSYKALYCYRSGGSRHGHDKLLALLTLVIYLKCVTMLSRDVFETGKNP